jgi:hypothetical protein
VQLWPPYPNNFNQTSHKKLIILIDAGLTGANQENFHKMGFQGKRRRFDHFDVDATEIGNRISVHMYVFKVNLAQFLPKQKG